MARETRYRGEGQGAPQKSVERDIANRGDNIMDRTSEQELLVWVVIASHCPPG